MNFSLCPVSEDKDNLGRAMRGPTLCFAGASFLPLTLADRSTSQQKKKPVAEFWGKEYDSETYFRYIGDIPEGMGVLL